MSPGAGNQISRRETEHHKCLKLIFEFHSSSLLLLLFLTDIFGADPLLDQAAFTLRADQEVVFHLHRLRGRLFCELEITTFSKELGDPMS